MIFELERRPVSKPNWELTPEEQNLKRLFVLSFQYSQGVPSIQKYLFRWNWMNDFLPNNIPLETPLYITNLVPPSVHASMPPNENESDKERYENEIEGQWRALLNLTIRESKDSLSKEAVVNVITEQMVIRDLVYQYRRRPLNDRNPHKSFIRQHAVMNNSTGHDSYNLLFEEIGRIIDGYGLNDLTLAPETKPLRLPYGIERFDAIIKDLEPSTALKHLVIAWNSNHRESGETFFPTS